MSSGWSDSVTARHVIGILIAILNGICGALYTANAQELTSRGFDALIVTLMSQIICMIELPPLIAATNFSWVLSHRTLLWVVFRSLTSLAGMVCIIFASTYLPLGEVYIFVCLTIPLTAIFSTVLLHEKLKMLDLITLGLTMTGSGLLMGSAIIDLSTENSWNKLIGGLFGISTALSWTISNLSYCYALREINHWPVLIVQAVVGCLVSVAMLMAFTDWESLQFCGFMVRVHLTLVSVLQLGCQTFMNLTLLFTTAGLASQTSFSSELVTGFVVQIVKGYYFTWWSGLGAFCVCVALSMNIHHYAKQLMVEREEETKLMSNVE